MYRPVITGLRARDIDVTSVSEAENEGLEDVEQLEFAKVQERVICTCNVGDFFDYILNISEKERRIRVSLSSRSSAMTLASRFANF